MGFSLAAWYTNLGKKYLLLTLWTAGCAVLFWRTYCYYKYDPGFYYVHQMLGPWLCISRGSAAVLNLNCGLVLLPMCRFLLTTLRRLHKRISLEAMRTLLDSAKGFHIACAFVICVNAVIHVVGHMFNARNFSIFYNSAIPKVNGAHSPNEDPIIVIISTVPGITGILMVLLLVMIVTSSVRYMREINYDLFWYTHRLIALFYILLLIHALRGPIRRQVNISSHTPGCNSSQQNVTSVPEPYPEPEAEYTFSSYACVEEPHFDRIGCQSWLWIGIPLILYIIDGACRMRQKETSVFVTEIVEHDCDVIEICMRTDMRKPSPGQYVLIQCPRISVFEWHPYSITKTNLACRAKFAWKRVRDGPVSNAISALQAPVQQKTDLIYPYISEHTVTERFREHIRELLEQEEQEEAEEHNIEVIFSNDANKRLKLVIDGPFGGPLDKVLQCGVSLCIGGGIGITPFISVLNYIRFNSRRKVKLRRLYLIWICRSVLELTCFIGVITATYQYLWDENLPDVLDVRFFVTGLNEHVECTIPTDHIEFVNKRISEGRPNWPSIFRGISGSHGRETVHVFVCGPRGLVQDVEYHCLRMTKHRTNFILHKESF